MKKTKGVSLDVVLGRELKDKEIKLAFDQSRFYLDVARLISNLREKKGVSCRISSNETTRFPSCDHFA